VRVAQNVKTPPGSATQWRPARPAQKSLAAASSRSTSQTARHHLGECGFKTLYLIAQARWLSRSRTGTPRSDDLNCEDGSKTSPAAGTVYSRSGETVSKTSTTEPGAASCKNASSPRRSLLSAPTSSTQTRRQLATRKN
jgi:hypothetical protein